MIEDWQNARLIGVQANTVGSAINLYFGIEAGAS